MAKKDLQKRHSVGRRRKPKFNPNRGKLKTSRTHKSVIKTALALWERLDTPVSHGLYLRAKWGLWREIAEFRIRPEDYSDHDGARFRKDYLAVSFLRKYPGLDFVCDREAAARVKFVESEDACSQTNIRFQLYRRGLVKPMRAQAENALLRARSQIAYVLGTLDLNEVFEGGKWGPGVTSAVSADSTSTYNKFDVVPETTASCLRYAWAAINCIPTWAQAAVGVDYPVSILSSSIPLVHGNRVTTVPKDALIDRLIAVEPHCNIFLQLGLGGAIRRRLLRVGVDLNNGQLRNGAMAKQGAQTGTLATIDLSSASDTISYELVKFLLPEEWFDVLNAVRSHRYTLSEKKEEPILSYAKFSSMGNGATFELESLIFWALAKGCLSELSVSDDTLCVYGDDIIVPVIAFPLLQTLIGFCGFSVNPRKTFATGVFRESCGEHFFGGLDVKPVFWDKIPETSVEMIAMANQLTLLAVRWGVGGNPLRLFKDIRDLIIEGIPSEDRLFGPVGHGDSFIIGGFDEASRYARRAEFGWEGYTFLSIQPVPVRRSMSSRAGLPASLYLARKGVEEPVGLRCDVSQYLRYVSDGVIVAPSRKTWSQIVEDWCCLTGVVSPSQGRYSLRDTIQYFEAKRLLVLRPQFVGVWQ